MATIARSGFSFLLQLGVLFVVFGSKAGRVPAERHDVTDEAEGTDTVGELQRVQYCLLALQELAQDASLGRVHAPGLREAAWGHGGRDTRTAIGTFAEE